MAYSDLLSKILKGNIKNEVSKKEDKLCLEIVYETLEKIKKKFKVKLEWEEKLYVHEIAQLLNEYYGVKDFTCERDTSHMKPDGGITYLVDVNGYRFPFLIAEVKSQGTNDKLMSQGKSKQALGNAIERLGKNVIGLRALLIKEKIFPFVCFGDGCDFAAGSTIRDRVSVIGICGTLNFDHTYDEGPDKNIKHGSYFIREKRWTKDEMSDIVYKIALKSIEYYFDKYGKDKFVY